MAATSLTPSKPLSHYHHDPTTPRPTMHMPHACEPLLAGWIASASIQQCMPGTTQPNNDRGQRSADTANTDPSPQLPPSLPSNARRRGLISFILFFISLSTCSLAGTLPCEGLLVH